MNFVFSSCFDYWSIIRYHLLHCCADSSGAICEGKATVRMSYTSSNNDVAYSFTCIPKELSHLYQYVTSFICLPVFQTNDLNHNRSSRNC